MDSAAGEIYQRFAATLAFTEWQPRHQLDIYRKSLLKRLVAFASSQSPFYRERLKPLFRSGSDPQLEAWSEIPLLRRGDLEAEIDRINPSSVPDEMGALSTKRTSGTTGGRVEFRTCALWMIAEECMMHRHFCWHGLDLTSPLASVRSYDPGRPSYPDGVTKERWSHFSPAAPHHMLDLREPLANIITWLVQRMPKYLVTFPSLMLDLAQHSGAAQLADLKLAKIIGTSESLTPQVRSTVRERLGCEIAQIYACAEVGCIALQSPYDDSYLACDETVFLEVLDDHGNPVETGQTGRVVLTSFYNYGTPFIRYEIGDFATLAAAGCSSGRGLMRLERINGRSSNALRPLSGGRVWPHQIPVAKLARHLSSARFQIHQPDRTAIEVVFTGEKGAKPADEGEIRGLFESLLGNGLDVRVSPVEDLARTPGGKRELVVSNVTN